ncbi:MAG TPA: hypothetical protein VNJ07_14260 [Chitinophagales bacterium]|nr:hypothetical protein [Chitinophagales bacterium]
MLLLVLATVEANAQDVIIFRNGDEVQAKVREIDTEHIKYVRYDNLNGPLYTIPRADVFMIKYENGTKDIITNLSKTTKDHARAFRSEYRSPGLAFLFSFLLPGGGQYYNGEPVKGGIMTGLWFAGVITTAAGIAEDVHCSDDPYNNSVTCHYDDDPHPAVGVGGTVMFGAWLWSVIDAPVRAAKNNRGIPATGLLEFENNKFSLSVELFRSHGLGGSLMMNF